MTATPGPTGRPFTEAKELDNPTATSIELGASPEGGYYNLRAFFGTNSGDYISSNTFTVTEVAPPDIPVNEVNIEITGFAPNAKISGAKIKLNTEGVEFVTQGTSPNILQTAFIAENDPTAGNILADDINATFQVGKQYYVRIIVDVKDGYARKYTSDQIYVTADGIPCTKTGKGFGGKPDVEGESKALLIYKLPMLVAPDAPTKGDLSGDDTVNNKDVEYLLWHTLFPTTYPVSQNADFNGDSKVDNKDVEYLLWHTLFPDTYPLSL